MKIVAVMPIKLNNERLPGKNTKLLNGKPLLTYELESLLKVDTVNEIYVYCSDNSIVPILPKGTTFLQRPSYLDLPTSNFTQIFDNFQKNIQADIYVYAHATAPYITIETMQECINAVVSDNYDSAFCASKIQDYLWMNGQPLNFQADNLPRSQDLQPIYRETSGIYVFKRDVFQLYKRRIGINPYIKEVTFRESIDINTYEDFKLAEIFSNLDV